MIEDSSVEMWLSRLGSSGRDCLAFFTRFFNEALIANEGFRREYQRVLGDGFEVSPSGLVEFQGLATGRTRFLIGDLARSYVNGFKDWTIKTKRTRLSYVNSFFLHCHAPLPPDASFKFSNSKASVQSDLPVEDFVTVVQSSNPMYSTIFLMLAQGLLDQKRLCHINTEHAELVVNAITKNQGIFRIPLPGRKNNPNPFFTMLSTNSDWATAFRHYMKVAKHDVRQVLFMNNKGEPVTGENIRRYCNRRAVEKGLIGSFTPNCPSCGRETVSRSFRLSRKVRKQGYQCRECGEKIFAKDLGHEWKLAICRHRSGKHPHEIRDLMSSRWGMSGADRTVREFIMGHTVVKSDPNKYEKIKYQHGFAEQEYRKALPYLNVLSEDPDKVSRGQVDLELEGTKQTVELLQRQLAEERRVNEERFREIKEWMERKATE